MNKTRLEAFSDGVLAIIITIMVLEIKAPHGGDLSSLLALWPKFLAYFVSFIYIAIYWVNHHHIMQVVHGVNGSILWSNIAMLFFLSIVPFSTSWMSENNFDTFPVLLYVFNLFLCGVAFTVWGRFLVSGHEKETALVKALQNNTKEKVSLLIYSISFLAVCVSPWLGFLGTVVVMFVWMIPDQRVEKTYR